jgi:hypothetical protein
MKQHFEQHKLPWFFLRCHHGVDAEHSQSVFGSMVVVMLSEVQDAAQMSHSSTTCETAGL